MTVRQLLDTLREVVSSMPELADAEVRVGSPLAAGVSIGRVEAFVRDVKERRTGVRIYQ